MRIGATPIERSGRGVYIIAEIGVNHDGSVERAGALVRAAAAAGADAVKFQVFRADLLMSRAARLAAYQAAAGERDPIEMLRRLELGFEDLGGLIDLAHRSRVHALATVFSLDLVAPAAELGWDAFKTASPDIVHRPLLRALADDGRPLIVSTGASTLDEVRRAVGWLDDARDRLTLLQCVSAYPVRDEDASIDGVAALRREFDVPVGYSDHTTAMTSGADAVRWGAVVLEKHLTYDRAAAGPDHAASLDPTMFAQYVRHARAAGPAVHERSTVGVKRVLEVEIDVRTASRQSIVAARDLRPGDVVTGADLAFKRPGTGLEPWQAGRLIGATVAKPVAADDPVFLDALEGWPAGVRQGLEAAA